VIPNLPSFRRLLAVTSALSMAVPIGAFAQDENGGGAPPARVGQITAVSGSVSFNGSGSGGWAAAADNYPVTAGDSLYTQAGVRAGIALDASQISLSGDTEIEVTRLDDNNFAATLSRGEIAFALNGLQPGQAFTIATPRGTVTISQAGRYDIAAGDVDNPTIVNVYQGAASVSDPGVSLQLSAGQAGIFSGSGQTTAQLGQAQQDSFTSTAFAANTPPPSYAPPVVDQMTGVAELGQYGAWAQSPQYGAIWYPAVSPGWAPYRQGHWADIQPWGWTWVENEPWGFAPFHYGRWVDAEGRWGWAPAPAYAAGSYGPAYQPVYAPAVVGFFGLAVAAGITAAALSSGSIGWVPLAPEEPYYPPYRCPPAYIRQINVVNVRNIDVVHVTNNYYYGSNFSPDRLANRRAATFVPAEVMRNGEHVAGYAHVPPQTTLAAARPIDTGFSGLAAPAADFRLPQPGRPMAELRPGAAPSPSDFAEPHRRPPGGATPAPLPAGPAFSSPGAMPPHAINGAAPTSRPGFATAPEFHAPPAPPAPGQHLAPDNFRPATENHAPPAFHPQETAPNHAQTQPHPGAPTGFQPAGQVYHPPAEAYHPPAQTYHPATEAYHPPAPAYHPPVEQFRPQEAAQPRPMPQPRPMEMPHPQPPHSEPGHGGGDLHHNP
jgi:hypothetical protein